MNEIEAYVAAVVGTLTGMTISEEEWNKLTDPELERTKHIFFKTPSGKRVEYIRADVLDDIRAEMEQIKEAEYQIYGKGSWRFVDKCLEIIDKHKSERSL